MAYVMLHCIHGKIKEKNRLKSSGKAFLPKKKPETSVRAHVVLIKFRS